MERADKKLAFLLQYENIAWYDNAAVKILDRRVYPSKIEFVTCRSHLQVAQAIADMVTQSAGPYTAAGMGMALAGCECADMSAAAQAAYLAKAAFTLSHARPTTAARMECITGGCLKAMRDAAKAGKNTAEAAVEFTVAMNNMRYDKLYKTACYLADTVPSHGAVMTQCFGETVVGQLCRVLKENGKENVKIFCPETRPYFQGARLTASVCRDMGMEVTVITDNMPAFVMKNENIDIFTSAADAVCMDGSIVNKVGTFQIAIAAKYNKIPYFVTGAPDRQYLTSDAVKIEMRSPSAVLEAMGVRTAKDGVKGYYPAFDITPPELVSGVVTDKGIYVPYDLERYFADGGTGEYEIPAR